MSHCVIHTNTALEDVVRQLETAVGVMLSIDLESPGSPETLREIK